MIMWLSFTSIYFAEDLLCILNPSFISSGKFLAIMSLNIASSTFSLFFLLKLLVAYGTSLHPILHMFLLPFRIFIYSVLHPG